MEFSDTIAAISTPSGTGGISIIRISGQDARTIGDRVFSAKRTKRLAELPGYTALYGSVHAGDTRLDEAIALVFAAPASYTGEDVVELSVHGGAYLTKAVLRAILAAGARLAEPGEFTKRAYLNHKLDLTQAEAVMALISAGGERQRQAALEAKEGALSKKVGAIRQTLLDLTAAIAAYTDYPDEVEFQIDTFRLLDGIDTAARQLDTLLSTYDTGRILREGLDTVIVGRPNVGKSTLMNTLLGCDRSIVTDIAGTTRDVVEESVQLGGITLRLSDTAGLRDTEDVVEAAGVARSRQRMDAAQLVLAVFDASQPLTQADIALLETCRNRSALYLLNKADLPYIGDPAARPEIHPLLAAQPNQRVLRITAKDPQTVEILSQTLEHYTGLDHLDSDAAILSSQRQYAMALAAQTALSEARATIEAGFTLDAVGVCLEEALNALLSLTGERATEAVADEVFRQFCVGK